MIIDILFVLAIIGILIAIYKTKFSQKKSAEQIKAEIMRETATKSTRQSSQAQSPKQQTPPTTTAAQWTGEQQEESERQQNEEQEDNSPANTRLSLYKQQKRREKQQRKQAQQHFLQQAKSKREQYEKLQEEKQRQQQQKRRKQQEYIEQMREEERKRKQQQFNKWKDMFEVEQSGVSKESQDQLKKKQQQLQNNLLSYLIKRKLTLLQDASHKFSLPTKELVQKIKKLQSQQKISGVFDQRGKYLFIEQRQWDAVRNYITAKGRLKKSEMMNECARIIKIPDECDDQLVRLVGEVEQQVM